MKNVKWYSKKIAEQEDVETYFATELQLQVFCLSS